MPGSKSSTVLRVLRSSIPLVPASSQAECLQAVRLLPRCNLLSSSTCYKVHKHWQLQHPRHLSSNGRAESLNASGSHQQRATIETPVAEHKEKQSRAPWHREGASEPPVRRPRSAGAMTKGWRIPLSIADVVGSI